MPLHNFDDVLCFEFFSGIKSLCATLPTSCRFYRPDLRAKEQVRASVVIEMRSLISFLRPLTGAFFLRSHAGMLSLLHCLRCIPNFMPTSGAA